MHQHHCHSQSHSSSSSLFLFLVLVLLLLLSLMLLLVLLLLFLLLLLQCGSVGNRVVVRCMTPKLTEVALPFQFQPNRWYHVVITHTTGTALSSSVVRLFVDASLEGSSRFKYAKVWCYCF